MKYFLSTSNAIYLLVIDISLPLSIQKEQLNHWISYLKSQVSNIEKIPIFVIGSKEDLVTESQKLQIREYYSTLKSYTALEFVTVSAMKSININVFIQLLKNRCMGLLNEKEYFQVPHIYKHFGDYIKRLRDKDVVLLG